MANMQKKTRNNPKKSRVSKSSSQLEIIQDFGIFNLPNGDVYRGSYKINPNKNLLLRHGHGIYEMHDYNFIDTEWVDDKIGNNVLVKYNSGAEFKFSKDPIDEMKNEGIYKFPDGSSITSSWYQNRPVKSITYMPEPSGHKWKGNFNSSNNLEIIFTEGNHFWDDLKKDQV